MSYILSLFFLIFLQIEAQETPSYLPYSPHWIHHLE